MELILEGVTSEEELKAFEIPEKQMIAQNRKVQRIGETVYFALRLLRSGNRCGLQVSFVRKEDTAKKLLEIFYYYYRNYERAVAPLRKEQKQ